MSDWLYVRFVEGKGWDSLVIRYFTKCRWSHVEFLEDGKTFGAQLKGGVRERLVTDKCYRHVETEVWRIQVTDAEMEQYRRFKQRTAGRTYNWRAILSFALGPINWSKPGTDICSQEVAEGLKDVGRMRLDLPSENYTPRDIYMLMPGIMAAERVTKSARSLQ